MKSGKEHIDLKDRTKQFAIAGVKLYQTLSKDTASQVMGRQFLRSATSVGANTRSAFRGRSSKEFKSKLGIVIEEADECGFWLELMNETEIAEAARTDALLKEADELVSIFTSIVKRERGKLK